MASSHDESFAVDPKAQHKADPNKRHRWLIPLLIAAQIAFKVRAVGSGKRGGWGTNYAGC